MSIGSIGGFLGGIFQASAANKAAKAQEAAADKQIALQKEIYADQTKRFDPYSRSGGNALNALNYEMGLGPKPTSQGYTISETTTPGQEGYYRDIGDPRDRNREWVDGTAGTTAYSVNGQSFDTRDAAQSWIDQNSTSDYGGFTATPGYQFRMQEGINALDNSAASRGQLFSGASGKAMTRYGQNFGTSEYAPFLDRLTGMAGMGQSAAGMQATAGQNYANGASNALANIGDARAAGAIGVGNALNGGIQNGIGMWGYQNALNRPGGSGGSGGMWGF